ncbi:MAG TPA: ABC transporter substrate-binding protein [Acetobacteraceae bacterium]|nr:ABC transporter substrate-binding protein [Acetobacteraceae bacterium]
MQKRAVVVWGLVAALAAGPASAQKADVMHWWTSGGESRAVAVFAKEYDARGGTWVDDASVGPQAEHAAALNRIAGGNPPTAMQWNIGVAVRQLAEQGALAPLDDLAKKGNWLPNLPPLLVKNMSYNGQVIAVPVDLHGANWMFYSTKVFDELKMQPPKTWDELFAMAPKIKAAGYIPLAYGANAQQVDWLFEALLAGAGGKDLYRKVWVDHDAKAAGSADMVHVFDLMGKLRQYVDAGSPNRKWNDTLALVETNKAALMIVGDWAKGDFAAAGKKLGTDYGCQMAPGNQDAYVMTVDVFVFPKNSKPDQQAAQDKLAQLMMDPAVQTRFNAFKGALPARLDANIADLDACAQLGQKVISGGAANQLPNFALAFSPDTQGQIEDLLVNYWANAAASPAVAAKQLGTIIANESQ